VTDSLFVIVRLILRAVCDVICMAAYVLRSASSTLLRSMYAMMQYIISIIRATNAIAAVIEKYLIIGLSNTVVGSLSSGCVLFGKLYTVMFAMMLYTICSQQNI
jgi:hypothetical protein